MIWFTCKQCGTTHSRPDSEVGTMIFCGCGRGITVPWNSTVAPPNETPEAVPVPAVPRPRAVPVPVDEKDQPARKPSRKLPPTPPSAESLPQKKKRTLKRANPAYCFNHDETNSQTACDDCKLSFCHDCVVAFGGKTLCGPCKNFRLRDRATPGRLSTWAVLALVVGFAAGPPTFCLAALPLGAYQQGYGSPGLTVLASLLALVPAGLACWLGIRALHQLDREPLLHGRALALTGLLSGGLGCLWTVVIALVGLLPPLR